MPSDLLNRTSEQSRTVSRRVSGQQSKLTGDALISFISGCQSNLGKSTYYNMKEEQKEAMDSMHNIVFNSSRYFYTLMMLPSGVNDINRQHIALNLIKKTLREEGLKDNQNDSTTRWENEIIINKLCEMPVPRVFDFFLQLQEEKQTKKRVKRLIKRYLFDNKDKWGLWTIKYREQFKRILRHINVTEKSHRTLRSIDTYIKTGTPNGYIPQLIKTYIDVQNGDKNSLAKLPVTVAEGFKEKFGLTKAEFDKLYIKKGGQFTAKEKQIRATSVAKSGQSTGLDMDKMKLFDLLVYINSLSRLPKGKKEIEKLIERKAKAVARTLSFSLDNVGLILDTSTSMFGTEETKFHPLLKGVAISAVLKQASNGFKEYRTNGSAGLIPKISNQSNYADSVLKALEDGCETLIIVGDGYENAPFEGAVHNLLYTYKKKVDKNNKLAVLHLNPVFASEAFDARAISSLAPQIGVKGIEGLNETMFLAIAKNHPEKAIEGYARNLIEMQSKEAKALMPTELKEIISDKTKKIT